MTKEAVESIISIPGLPPLKWLDTTTSITDGEDDDITTSPTITSSTIITRPLIGCATVDETKQSLTMTTAKETDWFNPPPTTATTTESPAALCNAPALVFQRQVVPQSSVSSDDNDNNDDWQLSAKVTMEHHNLFDAGTIFLHQGPNDWCKLCFEYSPEQQPTIVSVVTQDISDDANGPSIISSSSSSSSRKNNNSSNTAATTTTTTPSSSSSVYLRVSKYASVIAFHYSLDNDNDNINNEEEDTTKTNNNSNSNSSDDNKGKKQKQQQHHHQQYWTLHRVFSMRNINKLPMSIGFLAQAPVGPDSCSVVFSEIQYHKHKTLQNLRDGS